MRLNNNDIQRSLNEAINNVVNPKDDSVILNEDPSGPPPSWEYTIYQIMNFWFGYTNDDNTNVVKNYDYDGNGVVDFNDILIILSLWQQGIAPLQAYLWRDSFAPDGQSTKRVPDFRAKPTPPPDFGSITPKMRS